MTTKAYVYYKQLRHAEWEITKNQGDACRAREALAEVTGHGMAPITSPDPTCICGWRQQSHDRSDNLRAVGEHILKEWEKAASE